MKISSSYVVPLLPLISYLTFVFFRKISRKKKNLRPLFRKAVGCQQSACVHFVASLKDGNYCEQNNKDHFQKYSGSHNPCEVSQARISPEELSVYQAFYSKRAADLQNIIAVIAILATAIIALLDGGNYHGK